MDSPAEILSKKELEIAGHLAHGRTNQQIAEACDISENTVKTHLKNIYKKLQVENRTQAVLLLFAPR